MREVGPSRDVDAFNLDAHCWQASPYAPGDPPDLPDLLTFLDAVRPRLRRLLNGSGLSVEDAEDLVQDALVVVIERWSQMEGVVSREAWLLGTLRYKLFLHWRRRDRERRLQAAIAPRQPLWSEPPPQALRDSLLDVAAVTADLSERDLQLLWLCYALELPDTEAAVHLGCRPGSVRKLSRRALKRAQRQLACA